MFGLRLTEYILLKEETRRRHVDLGLPCDLKNTTWTAQNKRVFLALLEIAGVEDDVASRSGAGIHVAHVCEHHSHSETPCANPLHCYLATVSENSQRKLRTVLPSYDGSSGALPDSTVSAADLMGRYKVTKPTFYKRREALLEAGFVAPRREAGRVLYSPENVYYFDCFHYWAKLGYTVKEVVNYLAGLERQYWTGPMD